MKNTILLSITYALVNIILSIIIFIIKPIFKIINILYLVSIIISAVVVLLIFTLIILIISIVNLIVGKYQNDLKENYLEGLVSMLKLPYESLISDFVYNSHNKIIEIIRSNWIK